MENKNYWNNAKWIAFENLDRDKKLVPGVHCLGENMYSISEDKSIVPMFRKEFDIVKKIESASIIISGLGHYESYINGDKIGNSFLAPGWTNYEKTCLYNEYDITQYIKEGGNAIGIIVGNGFYNISRERYRKLAVAYGYPKLIFSIKIVYKNGHVENIVSDKNCKGNLLN